MAPAPIAFQAKVGAGGVRVGLDQVVQFKNLMTKLGAGFDADGSFFKAPEQATYLFNFVIYANNANSVDEFHFYRQGRDTGVGCYNLGDFSTPCASSLVLELAEGERVDVRYKTAATPYLRLLSSFSGVRLDFGLGDGYGAYAFQARGQQSAPLTNIGQAYHNSAFTVKVKAVYYFSFQVPATESNLPDEDQFSFFLNDVSLNVGCFRKPAHRDSCSSALVKVLNIGDTVTVKQVNTSKALFDSTVPRLTFFQGMLLRQASHYSGTSFQMTSSGNAVASNNLVWDQPLLARKDSTWYTKQKFEAPSQGTYFFTFYVLSDKAGGEIQFTKQGSKLGIGCYDDGSFRRVCRGNALLSLAKGDEVGISSTRFPVAPQNLNGGSFTVSQFSAFQLDEATASGIVQDKCLTQHKQYAPDLQGQPLTIQTTKELCQSHCKNTVGCAHFSWNTVDQVCHVQGKFVQIYTAHYVVSGPMTCDVAAAVPAQAITRKLPRQFGHPSATPAPMLRQPQPQHQHYSPTSTSTPSPTSTSTPTPYEGPSTPNPFEANGAVPGALIAGGVTLAGAAVGGLVGALVHNAQQAQTTTGNVRLYSVSGKEYELAGVTLSWPTMLMIGGVCSLLAAVTFGLYIRRKRSTARVAVCTVTDEETFLKSDESLE